MADIIALRTLVKSILNTNAIDPFPSKSTRRGNHFFSEDDNFNFNRGDSFPKGYIQTVPNPPITLSGLGRTGYAQKWGTLDIFYYAKEKQKSTQSSIVYQNQDLVMFMKENIITTLLANALSEYHLFTTSFGQSAGPRPNTQGNFKLWEIIQPVTYTWYEKYGS